MDRAKEYQVSARLAKCRGEKSSALIEAKFTQTLEPCCHSIAVGAFNVDCLMVDPHDQGAVPFEEFSFRFR
jgi:hypothetical protein